LGGREKTHINDMWKKTKVCRRNGPRGETIYTLSGFRLVEAN